MRRVCFDLPMSCGLMLQQGKRATEYRLPKRVGRQNALSVARGEMRLRRLVHQPHAHVQASKFQFVAVAEVIGYVWLKRQAVDARAIRAAQIFDEQFLVVVENSSVQARNAVLSPAKPSEVEFRLLTFAFARAPDHNPFAQRDSQRFLALLAD